MRNGTCSFASRKAGLVQAKWTDQILDEMLSNLGKKRPDVLPEKLGTLRELMNKVVRDCLVTGYEPLVESLRLPDPDERHVLAAAIRPGAVCRGLAPCWTTCRKPTSSTQRPLRLGAS